MDFQFSDQMIVTLDHFPTLGISVRQHYGVNNYTLFARMLQEQSRLKYYGKLHTSVKLFSALQLKLLSLEAVQTKCRLSGGPGGQAGGLSPLPLPGFLSALPSQYPGRPRAPQARVGTGRPCGLRLARGSGLLASPEPTWPRPGGLRLQAAPRRAYLGRGAEAAAESGAGRAGEGGEHGWSGRGADRQAKELAAGR